MELPPVDLNRWFGPYDYAGTSNLLRDGPLRGQSPAKVLVGPATIQEPLLLGALRAGDAGDLVEIGGGVRFEKQRDHYRRRRVTGTAPSAHLAPPFLSNPGVKDGFQLGSSPRLGKNHLGESRPIKRSRVVENVPAKYSDDLGQSREPRLNHIPGDTVGVDHRNSQRCQVVRRG